MQQFCLLKLLSISINVLDSSWLCYHRPSLSHGFHRLFLLTILVRDNYIIFSQSFKIVGCGFAQSFAGFLKDFIRSSCLILMNIAFQSFGRLHSQWVNLLWSWELMHKHHDFVALLQTSWFCFVLNHFAVSWSIIGCHRKIICQHSQVRQQ